MCEEGDPGRSLYLNRISLVFGFSASSVGGFVLLGVGLFSPGFSCAFILLAKVPPPIKSVTHGGVHLNAGYVW